jgi:6-phosphofructokinase 2
VLGQDDDCNHFIGLFKSITLSETVSESSTMSDRPITTLCLNPALDVSYEVEQLIAEQKTRAFNSRHDPGGNGINVGRALKRMQIEAHNFCVIAGYVGQIFQKLLADQLDNVIFEQVSGETRVNTTIIENKQQRQFQVTDAGTDIPLEQQQRLIDDFINITGKGYAVITGSCQPNIPKNLYAQLVERVQQQGGRAIIDTHGEMLELAIAAKPFLIKPNQYELETLLDKRFDDVESVAIAARQIQQSGLSHVCVSMGEKGALMLSADSCFYAEALKVDIKSTVGAGDSMVAGMVAAFSQGHDARQALIQGIACGAGTVMHPGTELFNGAELEAFKQQVIIHQLTI